MTIIGVAVLSLLGITSGLVTYAIMQRYPKKLVAEVPSTLGYSAVALLGVALCITPAMPLGLALLAGVAGSAGVVSAKKAWWPLALIAVSGLILGVALVGAMTSIKAKPSWSSAMAGLRAQADRVRAYRAASVSQASAPVGVA